jgi:hypothetical protein
MPSLSLFERPNNLRRVQLVKLFTVQLQEKTAHKMLVDAQT